jgi:hypothetical protein
MTTLGTSAAELAVADRFGSVIGGMTTSIVGGDADQRSDRNAARTSVVKRSGSCQAAKWLPLPTSLK